MVLVTRLPTQPGGSHVVPVTDQATRIVEPPKVEEPAVKKQRADNSWYEEGAGGDIN